MKQFLVMPLLILIAITAMSQDNVNTGIIYGKNHAFRLSAPKGWVLDNKSGVSQGLHAVFYPKGQSWKEAPTVMYANTASLEDDAHRTLEKLIEFDLNNFKKNYPGISVTEESNIKIKENVVAKVRYLSGQTYGNYEAIAYIDEGKTGVMIILSSRTKEGFENSLRVFNELVTSYVFLGEGLNDKK